MSVIETNQRNRELGARLVCTPPPDCALWSPRDGGCFATSCEFCRGRDSGACP